MIYGIVIIGAFGFIVVKSANASFLAMVTNLFDSKDGPISITENSQNMSLLQASLNINEKAARGGADIFIAEDSVLIPESGPNGSPADVLESDIPRSDQISVYIVDEGDTLSQIAQMFNVSVNTILWSNDIKNGIITPGMRLVILPISGVRHTVKEGDTMESITKKYGGNLDEVVQYNNIALGATLTPGSVVVIPDGEIATPVQTTSVARTQSSIRSGSVSSSGYFTHPLPGSIRTQGLHGHNGVDLGAPTGTPILAAADGEVIISLVGGWNGGYGNYIVVRHGNGTQTLYAHTSRNAVTVGQTVKKGQVIGYVGSTGQSTGPHLHFEVRGATNPFAY